MCRAGLFVILILKITVIFVIAANLYYFCDTIQAI